MTRTHLECCVCPDLDSASARLGSASVALVLAHLPAVGGDSGATQLPWAVVATRRPCSTPVLADSYHEHQATALLRAGADYLELPLDLGKAVQAAPGRRRARLRAPGQQPGGAAEGSAGGGQQRRPGGRGGC